MWLFYGYHTAIQWLTCCRIYHSLLGSVTISDSNGHFLIPLWSWNGCTPVSDNVMFVGKRFRTEGIISYLSLFLSVHSHFRGNLVSFLKQLLASFEECSNLLSCFPCQLSIPNMNVTGYQLLVSPSWPFYVQLVACQILPYHFKVPVARLRYGKW